MVAVTADTIIIKIIIKDFVLLWFGDLNLDLPMSDLVLPLYTS